jgi:hypothetical protein
MFFFIPSSYIRTETIHPYIFIVSLFLRRTLEEGHLKPTLFKESVTLMDVRA